MPMPSPEERPDLYDGYDNPDPVEAARNCAAMKDVNIVLPQYMLDRLAEVAAENAARAKAGHEGPKVGGALTDRFSDALIFAERLHRDQRRKGSGVPYIAHLLAVCAIVLEWGGGEDTAIAALLHDAVEDQGGLETLALIKARYGSRVAQIVSDCTDSISADPTAKPPWEERKRAHIAHLASATPEVALVTAADKLNNVTAMIRDVRRDGPRTLARFKATPEQQLWYFASVAAALSAHRALAPIAEIEEGVATLAALLGLVEPHHSAMTAA